MMSSKNFRIGSFQSTPSVGRATLIRSALGDMGIFQSTPSVGRATCEKKT